MKFGHKVFLLTVIPVFIAMIAMVWLINTQAQALATMQTQEYQTAILEMRKNELRQYLRMAKSVVAQLQSNETGKPEQRKEHATDILNALEFSEDGYFYVYSQDGTNIVHPRQPFRVGQNWWGLTDSNGKPVIQSLINEAKNGGGYTEYLWEKPSSGELAKKIGYSELLEDTGWMIGTGVYVDDIERQVAATQNAMTTHINSMSWVVSIVAALAVLTVFICGLFLQLNERKLADGKLKQLAQRIVQTQDEERRRVSRELHDSISQSLVAIKYCLEDIQHPATQEDTNQHHKIEKSIGYLDDTLSEVRRISRDLHPSILDDLGLMAAVDAMLESFHERTQIKVDFSGVKVRHLLPQDARTALYRVVQEALMNIERHSGASEISIEFSMKGKWFGVLIIDNGCGFNPHTQQQNHKTSAGIGLRNMSERLAALDGIFNIKSSPSGSQVYAALPKNIMNHSHATGELS